MRKAFTTNGTYPWSFVTQIFQNGQQSHGGDHETFEVIYIYIIWKVHNEKIEIISCVIKFHS